MTPPYQQLVATVKCSRKVLYSKHKRNAPPGATNTRRGNDRIWTRTIMTEYTAVRTDNRFSQIPHWVTEAPISDGAYRLYGVLMKYAHYQTRDAYPSRATLARDVRKSDRSVDGYIKELCAIGALKVFRRKRKGTKENYTNLYHVITANPHADDELSADAPEADWEIVQEVAKSASPGGEVSFAENDTHSTTPSSYSTSEETSDNAFHAHTPCEAPKKHPLPVNSYIETKQLLTQVGQAIQETGSFHSDEAQEAWDTFTDTLIAYTENLTYHHTLADLLLNGKWTVTACVADDYEAGKEITTMLNTARKQDG